MREPDTMSGKKRASIVGLLCLLFLCPASAADRMSPLPGLSIYNLTSRWTRQDGVETDLSAFRGHPVIVSMIYTSCPDICPLVAENMEQIESALPERLRSQVTFALFSFDPDKDTPSRLKDFASLHRLDMRHWALFRGDDAGVRELAAALDISYRKNDDGSFDHAVVISLLDADGVVVYRQVGFGTDAKDFVSHVEALAGTK